MKISIPIEPIKEFVVKRKSPLIFLGLVVIVVINIAGVFLSLNPGLDSAAQEEGEKTLNELQIRFDNDIITELSQEKAPGVVNGQGGRNPFSSY